MLIASALAAGLTACSTLDARQAAEKADIDASLAYAAIATAANAFEARAGVTPSQVVNAEALKRKAWEALTVERQTYALAGTVDLTALTALAVQAKTLGN